MAAKRQHRASLAALGVVLLAAIMTGLAACATTTGDAATRAGSPTAAARGPLGGKATSTATPTAAPQSASGGTSTTPGSLGTIAGDVVAGPTCPVETIENPCPPKPVTDRKVSVMTLGGVVAATAMTDGNGHFTVRIPAGTYTVHVEAGPGLLGLSQVTPGDVTVHAGQVTTVRIELDTGIR